MSKSCNVLVVGWTGAGKSSLVNYLTGAPVAQVGVGTPQTDRDDVPSYQASFGDIKMRLFDSWGTENDKVSEWKNRIRKIVEKGHGGSTIGAVWFHVVVYCISCGNSRVQDLDCEMIQYFRSEGFSVVIALTKADQADDAQMMDLKRTLNFPLPKVPVSSGGENRMGTINPCGKDDLLNALIIESIGNLPERQSIFSLSLLEEWKKKMYEAVRYKKVSRIENKNLENWIQSQAEEFSSFLSDKSSAFIRQELLIFSRLGNYSSSSLDCSLLLSELSHDLSFGETVLCVVLAPLLLVPAVLDIVFNGEKQERKKLEGLICKYERHFINQVKDVKGMQRKNLRGRLLELNV
ncbi:GTPase domain-containing protein [Pontiellaceae bacterium B12227]|nr:GTPase domain-containing protein [Pontiellaceae bacterium B12227]